MRDLDLISIILPVFNGEDYLSDSIQSCLDQTYKNFELIIVDDASTDSSPDIARAFGVKDSRIKLIENEKNLKLPASLNIGHRNAQGKYLTWTSDDNILKPKFLELLSDSLIKHNVDVIFSNFEIIWKDGTFKREQKAGPVSGLLFGNTIGASFLYKEEVFKRLDGYKENLFLAEDYHFFLMASINFKFYHLKENLYKYRIHSASLSGSIQSDNNYSKKHLNSIIRMFQDLGEKLEFNLITIKFLADLYFEKSTPLSCYLKNQKVILSDILSYEKMLFMQDNKNVSIKNLLRLKLRGIWANNKTELNKYNLLRVLIKDRRLLISRKVSIGTTYRLISKSF